MPNLDSSLILAAYIIILLTGLPANLLALRSLPGQVRQPHPARPHPPAQPDTGRPPAAAAAAFKIIEAASDFLWELSEESSLCPHGFRLLQQHLLQHVATGRHQHRATWEWLSPCSTSCPAGLCME